MAARRIIDIHNHIYPAKVAPLAVNGVGSFYGIPMHGDGTTEDMMAQHAKAGISRALVHSVATKAKQVKPINDFIAGEVKKHPQLVGFATMHQDFEDKEAEVERAIALGLKGFKIHPDSQGVNVDDPRLMEFYGMIEGRLPIMIHCGDYRYDFSHPRRVKAVLHEFPNLVVDAAHFGGWSIFDLALEYLQDENCFMDISSSMALLGARRTRELIELNGVDRIMFGSDYPMWSPGQELQRFLACEMDEKDNDKILWHNAERYLGFDL
jgi:predicted TIM-barrel fold metal-dependent hydrolase